MALHRESNTDSSVEHASTGDPETGVRFGLSRRQFIAGSGAAALGASAGCTTVADWLADRALGDVTVFNETDGTVRGTIAVIEYWRESAGGAALEKSFDLGSSADDDGDGESTRSYDDVWNESGTYEVTVELDDGVDVRGDSEASTTVTVEDPDEVMLAVVLGAEEFEAGIAFTVGEDWSEFDREGSSE